MRYAVGVDLGATWVRVALIDEHGTILQKMAETIVRSGDAAVVGEQIVKLFYSLDLAGVEVDGVGIGSAGPLNIKKGTLINPTNMPWSLVPLVKPISKDLGLPTYLLNDCTIAVMGERAYGAGEGLDDLVYITLSTGIGGGAYVDGHLLIGTGKTTVEIGHIVIDYNGRLICGCGKRGHWEAYCSGRNIPLFAQMWLKEAGERWVHGEITPKLVYGLAKREDSKAIQIVEAIGKLNAMGIATVINVYDPSLVTIGGGIAVKNPDLVLGPIKRHVAEYTVNRVPPIEITSLGANIGLLGAAALAFHPEDYLRWISKN